MKTIKIYKRDVIEYTGFRQYPYKQVTQVVIMYDGEVYRNDHYATIDNPRARVKFNKVLETRSLKKLNEYLESLGRSNADEFIKYKAIKVIQ